MIKKVFHDFAVQRYILRTILTRKYNINERFKLFKHKNFFVINYYFSNVLDPPGAPIIIDYSAGNPIPSGNVHKISCLSTGGNPLATVTWFKNDKKVQCDT